MFLVYAKLCASADDIDSPMIEFCYASELHICPIFDMNVVLKVLVWDIETQASAAIAGTNYDYTIFAMIWCMRKVW